VVLNPDDLQATSLGEPGPGHFRPLRATNSAMVKAHIAGELRG
jgi:hypothetical protein